MADARQTRESSGPTPQQRTRPCDACRRRKSKCVLTPGEAVCVLCALHSLECRFSNAPGPKRKAPATTASGSDSGWSPGKRVRLLPGRGVEFDVRPGTTLLKRTLGLQNLHHSRYLAPHGIIDVYDCLTGLDLSPRPSNEGPDQPPAQVRLVHPQHAFQIIADADTPNYDDEDNFLDRMDELVSDCAAELVSLYFRIVHPSFPILQKDVFLEKHARSHHEFSPPCLAAVYLLALDFWSYSDALSAVPKPNVAALKQLAFDSLDVALTRPKLSSIQGGLLLSQYFAAEDKALFASRISRITTQLVDVAFSLGLHIDPGDWDIPHWEIGLRRRLSWAVFMQDKWTSLLHGCSPRILAAHWERYSLQPEDFPEHVEDETAGSSEVYRGRLVFTELTSLTCILSDILDNFLSIHFQRLITSNPDGLAIALSHLQPFQHQLQSWSNNLPPPLRSSTDNPLPTTKLSSIGQLRLAHLAIEASLHRFILRTIFLPSSHPSSLTTAVSNASETFTSALHFLSNLQAPQLASFWYSSTSARACVVIYQLGNTLLRTLPTVLPITRSTVPNNPAAIPALPSTSTGQPDLTQPTPTMIPDPEDLTRQLQAYKWALKMNARAAAEFCLHALEMINTVVSERSFVVTSSASGQGYIPTSVPHARGGGGRNMAGPEGSGGQAGQGGLEAAGSGGGGNGGGGDYWGGGGGTSLTPLSSNNGYDPWVVVPGDWDLYGGQEGMYHHGAA